MASHPSFIEENWNFAVKVKVQGYNLLSIDKIPGHGQSHRIYLNELAGEDKIVSYDILLSKVKGYIKLDDENDDSQSQAGPGHDDGDRYRLSLAHLDDDGDQMAITDRKSLIEAIDLQFGTFLLQVTAIVKVHTKRARSASCDDESKVPAGGANGGAATEHARRRLMLSTSVASVSQILKEMPYEEALKTMRIMVAPDQPGALLHDDVVTKAAGHLLTTKNPDKTPLEDQVKSTAELASLAKYKSEQVMKCAEETKKLADMAWNIAASTSAYQVVKFRADEALAMQLGKNFPKNSNEIFGKEPSKENEEAGKTDGEPFKDSEEAAKVNDGCALPNSAQAHTPSLDGDWWDIDLESF